MSLSSNVGNVLQPAAAGRSAANVHNSLAVLSLQRGDGAVTDMVLAASWAGLGSVQAAAPAEAAQEGAPDEDAAALQQRKEEVFHADNETNRAIVAAIAQGLSGDAGGCRALLALAEAAGPDGQHVLLLALCHACASGRGEQTGDACQTPLPALPVVTSALQGPVISAWPSVQVRLDTGIEAGCGCVCCAGAAGSLLALLLPDLPALGGDMAVEAGDAWGHFQDNDGLPTDDHFAALATDTDSVRGLTRRHALLTALQHACGEDLAAQQGGAAGVFARIAQLSPQAAFEAHMVAIVDAAAGAQRARRVPVGGLRAAQPCCLGARPGKVPNTLFLLIPVHAIDRLTSSEKGYQRNCRRQARCISVQVRALELLQARYAAPRPEHVAADTTAFFHTVLPRLLAAIASPERSVRAAGLAALPAAAASLKPSSVHGTLPAQHLAALIEALSRQRAALEADAGALPDALRYSLAHAQRNAKGRQDRSG